MTEHTKNVEKTARINQRTNHLLGTNIKKLRLKNKLRNKDIVAQLQLHGVEISTGTYSKVEMGLNNPSVDLLIALTDIFSCDFNAFFKKMLHLKTNRSSNERAAALSD